MRIVCPACSATYDVPEAKLAGRRSVRCVRCGERWAPDTPAPAWQEPPALAPMEPSPPEPEPAVVVPWQAPEPEALPFYVMAEPRPEPSPIVFTPAERLEPVPARWSPPEPPRTGLAESLPEGLALKLAWAGSIAVVLGIVTALLLGHGSVAAAWPPAQRLYGSLGLGAS